MSAVILECRNLTFKHLGRTVVDIPELRVFEGEILGIVGPNGAGKTTLVQLLSFLQRPDQGEIRFRGLEVSGYRDLLRVRRRMAAVFQEPLLLDTTVYGNVSIGLKIRGLPPDEVDRRVTRWCDRLGISEVINRNSRRLSGGESRRVSLARAFVLNPDVMFLDEPFEGLDSPTRSAMLLELGSILREVKTTAILITHDFNEIAMLADRVAVLMSGRIAQLGTPEEVFGRPASVEVAQFLGFENIVDGVAGEEAPLEPDSVTVRVGNQNLQVKASKFNRPVSGPVKLCFRADEVFPFPAGDGLDCAAKTKTRGPNHNLIEGRFVRAYPYGSLIRIDLDCGFRVTACVRSREPWTRLRPSQTVDLLVPPESICMIPEGRSPR